MFAEYNFIVLFRINCFKSLVSVLYSTVGTIDFLCATYCVSGVSSYWICITAITYKVRRKIERRRDSYANSGYRWPLSVTMIDVRGANDSHTTSAKITISGISMTHIQSRLFIGPLRLISSIFFLLAVLMHLSLTCERDSDCASLIVCPSVLKCV